MAIFKKFKRLSSWTIILSFACFILVLAINSCKKDVQMSLITGTANLNTLHGIEMIKSSFMQSGYDKQLIEDFKDTIKIVWKPNWSNATEKISNDTLNYFYVPLDGELYNPNTNRTIKKLALINTDKYLICKLTKSAITF